MKKSYLFITVIALLLISTMGANLVAAQTLLDDFSGAYLDQNKWKDVVLVREVKGDKLISKIQSSGTDTYVRNSTRFQNQATINVIQCDIVINEATLDTGTDVLSFARINGFFYNTAGSGNVTGDVWAGVYIGDRGSGLEAFWIVEEMLNDDRTSSNLLGEGTLIVPGLNYGLTYIVKLEYDGDATFTFTVAGVSKTINTGRTSMGDAITPFKALTVGAYSNGGSGSGFVSASFDNVQIDDPLTAYDDFSTTPLDQTNWVDKELVREISGGKLRLNVQAENERNTARITPVDQDTNYLEAKILIESGAQIPPGRSGLVRLAGFYYNNSRDGSPGLPYDGEIGDVWVTNRIVVDDNNQLSAFCSVWASDKPDGWDSNAPTIFREDFTTAISFDTAYTLSIEYTGSALIFKLNNETFQYDITGIKYPVSTGQYRTLQSRVYAENGESGQIEVQVDDVYVESDPVPDVPVAPVVEAIGNTGGGGGGGGCFISSMKE